MNARRLFLIVLTFIATSSAREDNFLNSLNENDIADLDVDELLRLRRIIGGSVISDGQFPWLVSIQGKIHFGDSWPLNKIVKKRYYCGASVISDRWLLSAAHCFISPHEPKLSEAWRWKARLADADLKPNIFEKVKGFFSKTLRIDKWRQWSVRFDSIIIHPRYGSKSNLWQNDIALIKLSSPVPSGNNVPKIKRVLLPYQDDTAFPPDGMNCLMTGWGCTSQGGTVASTAQEVILPKVNDTECGRFWSISTVGRLCAGRKLENAGICPGDSGGPLVCKRGNNWVQVGVASFTSANRPGSVPGVFTRVSHYRKWIRSIVNF